ncbi:phytanoyl-CoA dioxygenase family protein [Ferruginibacter sp. SUN002]|uniref:phytanoyl-CoA dioxygenase family protein n=1 Tax=Ferruginibacter sp. SUN002 TaxID=2937789 RepID=UPI003D35B7E6
MTLLQQFQTNGYLVLDNFNTAAECDALMQRGEELARNFNFDGHPSVFQTTDQAKTSDDYFINSGDKISFFFEKDAFDDKGKLKGDLFHSLNKIGHGLHDLDPVFNNFSRSPQMKKLASDLQLDDYLIIQSMQIFKHAKIGGVVDTHQDSTFLYTEPDSCIGFWFALEDATKENGCLWAKPGGHLTPLRSWFRKKEGGGTEMAILDNTPYEMEGMIPLEVKKGSCIVLHGLLPHYSLPNTSGKSRQAYSIHTINRNTHYPANNWLQRDMREVKGFF